MRRSRGLSGSRRLPGERRALIADPSRRAETRLSATKFTDSSIEMLLRENPNKAKKKDRVLGHDLASGKRRVPAARSRLSTEAGPGALMCPVCDLYTTKADHSLAVRQLSSHVAKAHPSFRWSHRYCNGPLHTTPVLMPLSDFNLRGRKREDWRRWCKPCEQRVRAIRLGQPNAGYVATAKVQPLLADLAARAGGYPAAARESGVAVGAVYNIRNGKTSNTEKDVAARIIAARSRLRGLRMAA
jgi:hypothetical protein